jgi:hypothetical protein
MIQSGGNLHDVVQRAYIGLAKIIAPHRRHGAAGFQSDRMIPSGCDLRLDSPHSRL